MPTRERPKSPEVQTPGNTPTRKQQSIKPSIAKRNIEQRRQPGNIYVPKKKTPPQGVQPAGVNSLVAPGFASNTVSGAANIVELARALKNDVDLIFEFVHNNIDFIPTFGSQKGGLGALIDGMGNAFDQSELMIELLREAGYTCSFQSGEVEITEAVAMNWLGTDGIWSSSNLLGTCGIPNETYWTGSEWKLRVSHCWVQVDISGTDYVFDPALKAYTNIAASIDLATALDYDRTDFMNDATSGATITSDYVEDMNRTNVRDNLATMTGNLVDYLRTNAPTATLDDVLGGRTINPVSGPVRQTSLPYLRPSTTPDTWSEIPNAYKATLGVFYDDGLNIDVSFYSKDIHGKRLTLTFNASHECELRLDGDLVATSAPQDPDGWNSVYLSITHPYANVWWDQGFWQTLWEGHPYMIAQAWGNAGRQMVEVHRAKLSQNVFNGYTASDENVIGETLAVWFNLWNAQKSWACDVFNRMTNCRTVLQHQIGLVGHFDTPTMDLGGIMWSTYCLENDEWPDPIDTNDTALAMHGIAFEAGAIEQMCGVGGISTTTILDKAVQDGLKIYDGRIDNWASDVRPNLSNYDSGTLDFIYNSYINVMDPWRVALPEDGQITKNDFLGYGFYAISPWYGAIGIFSGYLQGGMGDEEYEKEQILRSILEPSAKWYGKSVDDLLYPPTPEELLGPAQLIDTTNMEYHSPDPVDLRKGAFVTRNRDLAVGSRSFPYGLTFERYYHSSSRLKSRSLGLGWSHSHDMGVNVNTDGLIGMGHRNPIQGAAGLAQMFATVDLLRDLAKPLDKWVTVSMCNRWMLDQLRDNLVDIVMPTGGMRFVKLVDGSYLPALGCADRLELDGSNFKLFTPQGVEYAFDNEGLLSTMIFPFGVIVDYTYVDGKLMTVSNGMGRSLSFTYDGDLLDTVTDGHGRVVQYTYTDGNLTAVQNPDGDATTYEYDEPGRLTKIFKPENPEDPLVVNTYDSLGRVMQQADAYSNVTNFYFAGSRTEVEDAQSHSEIRIFNRFGKLTQFTDRAGKVWSTTYDGLNRCVRKCAHEGNWTEYTWDDNNNLIKVVRGAKPLSVLDDLEVSFTYDPLWNKIETSTDPHGNVTTRTYDEFTGNLVLVEYPAVDGKIPSMAHRYNDRGQLVSKIDCSGIQQRYVYGELNETLTEVILNADYRATISGTASVGNAVNLSIVDAVLTGGSKIKTYTVQSGDTLEDIVDGLVAVVNGDAELTTNGIVAKADGLSVRVAVSDDGGSVISGSTSGGSTVTISVEAGLNLSTGFTYDPVGNVLTYTNPKGNFSTMAYDNSRKLVSLTGPDPFEYESLFTYDKNGCLTKVERFAGLDENDDPVWQTTTATYTIDNQLQTATDSGGSSTEFSYDSRRKLFQTEDASGRLVSRTYDQVGRLSSIVGPDTITQASYTYTDNGLLSSVEDANHNITEYVYDGFDRLIKTVFEDATFEERTFGGTGRPTSFVSRKGESILFDYDNLGRIIQKSPAGMPTATFLYDLSGRLKRVSTPVVLGDSSSGDFDYLYDIAGRLVCESFPDGKEVRYQLDELGNVTRFTYPDNYYVERSFDELNRLTSIKLNGSLTDEVVFDYDELSRRTSVTYGNGVQSTYGFEPDSDLSSLIHTFAGSSVEFTYAFNDVRELASQSVSDAAFLYHPSSNKLVSYDANDLNQYSSVGGQAYVYDDNGCLVNDGIWEFGYNALNQLISASDGVKDVEFFYDARGRQIQRDVDGVKTQFVYSGVRLIAQYDDNGDLQKRFVYGRGIDEVLLEVDSLGAVSYLHHDRLGSVVATSNALGNVTKTYAYSPWGQCDDMSGTTFGFQGQRFDDSIGIYYMKARYYDQNLGRFIQPDPIGYGDGLNMYTFAYNNPNNFCDPLGLAGSGSGTGFGAVEEDIVENPNPSNPNGAQMYVKPSTDSWFDIWVTPEPKDPTLASIWEKLRQGAAWSLTKLFQAYVVAWNTCFPNGTPIARKPGAIGTFGEVFTAAFLIWALSWAFDETILSGYQMRTEVFDPDSPDDVRGVITIVDLVFGANQGLVESKASLKGVPNYDSLTRNQYTAAQYYRGGGYGVVTKTGEEIIAPILGFSFIKLDEVPPPDQGQPFGEPVG